MTTQRTDPAGRGERITLSLPSDPRFLGLLRTVVGTAADLFGFSESEKQGMMLAVNEGCANIIQHCYRMDARQKIDVSISVLEDRMEVDLRDYGKYSDPAAAAAAVKQCEERLEPGGLGLRLIRETMDEVLFRPAGREGTLLTMVKYRTTRGS